MPRAVSLRKATVQQIQLELLRRSRWNDLDGERVCASLRRNRELWLAVLLDRPGVPNYAEPSFLMTLGLVKLRDLPQNIWNADTLFILTDSHKNARRLARIAKKEHWGGSVCVYDDQKEVDRALGTGRREYGVVTIWWD